MKKYLFLMILIINSSVFAKSGFEAIINANIGKSIGIPIGAIGADRKTSFGFDAALTAQLGYLADFNNNMAMSILGEIGFSHDSFSYRVPNTIYQRHTVRNQFTSLQLGVLPKFNINNFSLGLGAGVKIPFHGRIETYTKVSDTESTKYYQKINFNDIKSMYNQMFVIPYVKLTFDWFFSDINYKTREFVDTRDFGIGFYLGYNFGPKSKTYIGTDSFDIGLELSLRFKPAKN
ncbi:hypothetical protein [Brachyspira sp. SAP_772]|uniref:hypothetical protein n=1 Tax=Brachyspira sp. SAP_772 TaxID=2608385 RepID=UPI0012F4E935|nr:hypothetical protein [Brachyspira sp. SAP_772]